MSLMPTWYAIMLIHACVAFYFIHLRRATIYCSKYCNCSTYGTFSEALDLRCFRVLPPNSRRRAKLQYTVEATVSPIQHPMGY